MILVLAVIVLLVGAAVGWSLSEGLRVLPLREEHAGAKAEEEYWREQHTEAYGVLRDEQKKHAKTKAELASERDAKIDAQQELSAYRQTVERVAELLKNPMTDKQRLMYRVPPPGDLAMSASDMNFAEMSNMSDAFRENALAAGTSPASAFGNRTIDHSGRDA